MAGMNFTEEIFFDFDGNPLSAKEIIPVVDRAWHLTTRALPESQTMTFCLHLITVPWKHFMNISSLNRRNENTGFLNWETGSARETAETGQQ